MKKLIVAAAAALAMAIGSMTIEAKAADLEFVPPPPEPILPTWAGFYFGGHVGYGEAHFDTRTRVDLFLDGGLVDESDSFVRSLRPNGLAGGVQGGFNWQINRLVLGVEGDISFTDWRRRAVTFDTDAGDLGGPYVDDFAHGRVSADVDFLASVRGRVGFAPGNLLIYGTGGVAWADARAGVRVVAFDSDTDSTAVLSRNRSFNDFGWVVGGGLGWMVIPNRFSLGVEGLYYIFGGRKTIIDRTHVFADGDSARVRARASLDDAWVIRARGDIHF